MRRTDRLFDILQVFRDGKLHKGEELAQRMEVSLRTIYRDIDTLVASGVPITGERGVGYLMQGPVFLPPLNITQGELEVLELGLALVQASFGKVISADAETLGDKVRAVLPRPEMLDPHRGSIGVYHTKFSDAERETLEVVRRGILARTKVRFDYLSLRQERSTRYVRPLEVQVWESVLTLTVWCEDRQDFRAFRLDRMENVQLTEDGYRLEPGKTFTDYLKRIAENEH
ncbi:YafY family protein [Rhodovulum sp. FJ3]|uniref:helix-turn-helix transcriptional regulator n=1 Tax=Rhodovulum sp. FJ3 TaxID=3079053 RepID=UPI00293DA728|nr:YafY family protein [Rhodovulum sp. FJ3]MDV4168238.1 YafY family protein [Rhodovulum sp. FJ3]